MRWLTLSERAVPAIGKSRRSWAEESPQLPDSMPEGSRAKSYCDLREITCKISRCQW